MPYSGKKALLQLEVDSEFKERLKRLAGREERSLAAQVRHMLNDALAEREKQYGLPAGKEDEGKQGAG